MIRFHRLYKWASDLRMSKKSEPYDYQTIRAPQTEGQAGWLILNRNPNPEALFVIRSQLSSQKVSYVIDERCFDDTIIRVEKGKDAIYLADIYVWQGVQVHSTMSFAERQELLKGFYKHLYTPCSAFEWMPLKLRSEATCKIKGYEYYSDEPGNIGSFTDDVRTAYTIRRTSVSDVYAVEGQAGYLEVPTLEVSQALRRMPDVFECYCKRTEDDEMWEIIAFKDK